VDTCEDVDQTLQKSGHVKSVDANRISFTVLSENPNKRGHSEDVGIDRKIILKWIPKK
jgi:hypothetical protein